MKIAAFMSLGATFLLAGASAVAKSKSWVTLSATTDAPRHTSGQPITVRLTARNTHSGPAYLKFTSGQRFDFQLFRAGQADAVYTWSANKMFAQMTGQLKLLPGQTQEFTAQIGDEPDALPPGQYQLRAHLTNSSGIEAEPIPLETVASPVQLSATTDKTQYKLGETVRVTLTALNTTSAVQTLRFYNGQSFDVAITNAPVEQVWKWAANKRFTMALRTVELKPGQSQTYEATWNGAALSDRQKIAPGTYVISATLTSNPKIKAPPVCIQIK